MGFLLRLLKMRRGTANDPSLVATLFPASIVLWASASFAASWFVTGEEPVFWQDRAVVVTDAQFVPAKETD